MRARLTGPGADVVVAALRERGVEVDDQAAALVYAALEAPALDDLEDALTDWIDRAREAADRDGDVVTVVADELVEGDDPAGTALGHGLISATRSYAMERERYGSVANVVVADPEDPAAAAATVAFLLEQRALSGDVLAAGSKRHGRQRP